MMDNNEQFKTFRAELLARKVHIQWMWQARRDGKPAKYPKQMADVGMIAFTGEGFQPSHLTAIVVDYGKGNGFGLYTDHGGLTITQDADSIAKARDTSRPHPSDLSADLATRPL